MAAMPHKIPFRNRGHEVTRVEAMSDVIFGFSISLLVVSLEAPKTYAQMMDMLHGFLPFWRPVHGDAVDRDLDPVGRVVFSR